MGMFRRKQVRWTSIFNHPLAIPTLVPVRFTSEQVTSNAANTNYDPFADGIAHNVGSVGEILHLSPIDSKGSLASVASFLSATERDELASLILSPFFEKLRAYTPVTIAAASVPCIDPGLSPYSVSHTPFPEATAEALKLSLVDLFATELQTFLENVAAERSLGVSQGTATIANPTAIRGGGKAALKATCRTVNHLPVRLFASAAMEMLKCPVWVNKATLRASRVGIISGPTLAGAFEFDVLKSARMNALNHERDLRPLIGGGWNCPVACYNLLEPVAVVTAESNTNPHQAAPTNVPKSVTFGVSNNNFLVKLSSQKKINGNTSAVAHKSGTHNRPNSVTGRSIGMTSHAPSVAGIVLAACQYVNASQTTNPSAVADPMFIYRNHIPLCVGGSGAGGVAVPEAHAVVLKRAMLEALAVVRRDIRASLIDRYCSQAVKRRTKVALPLQAPRKNTKEARAAEVEEAGHVQARDDFWKGVVERAKAVYASAVQDTKHLVEGQPGNPQLSAAPTAATESSTADEWCPFNVGTGLKGVLFSDEESWTAASTIMSATISEAAAPPEVATKRSLTPTMSVNGVDTNTSSTPKTLAEQLLANLAPYDRYVWALFGGLLKEELELKHIGGPARLLGDLGYEFNGFGHGASAAPIFVSPFYAQKLSAFAQASTSSPGRQTQQRDTPRLVSSDESRMIVALKAAFRGVLPSTDVYLRATDHSDIKYGLSRRDEFWEEQSNLTLESISEAEGENKIAAENSSLIMLSTTHGAGLLDSAAMSSPQSAEEAKALPPSNPQDSMVDPIYMASPEGILASLSLFLQSQATMTRLPFARSIGKIAKSIPTVNYTPFIPVACLAIPGAIGSRHLACGSNTPYRVDGTFFYGSVRNEMARRHAAGHATFGYSQLWLTVAEALRIFGAALRSELEQPVYGPVVVGGSAVAYYHASQFESAKRSEVPTVPHSRKPVLIGEAMSATEDFIVETLTRALHGKAAAEVVMPSDADVTTFNMNSGASAILEAFPPVPSGITTHGLPMLRDIVEREFLIQSAFTAAKALSTASQPKVVLPPPDHPDDIGAQVIAEYSVVAPANVTDLPTDVPSGSRLFIDAIVDGTPAEGTKVPPPATDYDSWCPLLNLSPSSEFEVEDLRALGRQRRFNSPHFFSWVFLTSSGLGGIKLLANEAPSTIGGIAASVERSTAASTAQAMLATSVNSLRLPKGEQGDSPSSQPFPLYCQHNDAAQRLQHTKLSSWLMCYKLAGKRWELSKLAHSSQALDPLVTSVLKQMFCPNQKKRSIPVLPTTSLIPGTSIVRAPLLSPLRQRGNLQPFVLAKQIYISTNGVCSPFADYFSYFMVHGFSELNGALMSRAKPYFAQKGQGLAAHTSVKEHGRAIAMSMGRRAQRFNGNMVLNCDQIDLGALAPALFASHPSALEIPRFVLEDRLLQLLTMEVEFMWPRKVVLSVQLRSAIRSHYFKEQDKHLLHSLETTHTQLTYDALGDEAEAADTGDLGYLFEDAEDTAARGSAQAIPFKAGRVTISGRTFANGSAVDSEQLVTKFTRFLQSMPYLHRFRSDKDSRQFTELVNKGMLFTPKHFLQIAGIPIVSAQRTLGLTVRRATIFPNLTDVSDTEVVTFYSLRQTGNAELVTRMAEYVPILPGARASLQKFGAKIKGYTLSRANLSDAKAYHLKTTGEQYYRPLAVYYQVPKSNHTISVLAAIAARRGYMSDTSSSIQALPLWFSLFQINSFSSYLFYIERKQADVEPLPFSQYLNLITAKPSYEGHLTKDSRFHSLFQLRLLDETEMTILDQSVGEATSVDPQQPCSDHPLAVDTVLYTPSALASQAPEEGLTYADKRHRTFFHISDFADYQGILKLLTSFA